MSRSAAALTALLASLSILLLAGCATRTTEPTSLSAAQTATAIGHVRPSAKDTCETQVQVAEQSSRIATIATGKETVYKPACAPAADKKAPEAKPEPKKVARWSEPLPIETASTRDTR